tara:strand:- start:2359 stop:3204 length:846 start_codon:yes stop_codon:yes gene_type:complete
LRLTPHLIHICILTGLFGGSAWTSQATAYLLPEKKWEIGLFQPLKYGFSEKTNYSIHPILFFIMPNLSVKVLHHKGKMFSSATRHGFYYPTKLLKILQTGVQVGDRTASLIAPSFKIPHMLGFSSDYIFTKPYKLGTLSLYAGVNLGLVFGDLDPRTSIDLPLVYHRLGVFYNKYGLDAGIDFSKNITDATSCSFDLDLKFLPGFSGRYSFEHKFLFYWQKSKRTRFSIGYKYVYGDFPYGKQSRLLPYLPLFESWVPMFDVQWVGLEKNRKIKKSLHNTF